MGARNFMVPFIPPGNFFPTHCHIGCNSICYTAFILANLRHISSIMGHPAVLPIPGKVAEGVGHRGLEDFHGALCRSKRGGHGPADAATLVSSGGDRLGKDEVAHGTAHHTNLSQETREAGVPYDSAAFAGRTATIVMEKPF